MSATESKSSEVGLEALDPLDGISIIDCDSHFTEPPDLWTARTPSRFKDRVPVQRTVDGVTAWYLDDKVWATTGGNVISRGGSKVLGEHVLQPFEMVDPGSWDVQERLALLDTIGIYAQICYPNAIGFASNHIFSIDDIPQREAILETYNDFLIDVQNSSNRRLLPQALLPIWDMELTIKEMKRLLDEGISGFTISDRPELLDLPELPEEYFSPMWDLANESGSVINFHIGSGMTRAELNYRRAQGDPESKPPAGVALPSWNWFSRSPKRRLVVNAALAQMSNIRILSNLLMSDLFDRYPKLRVVSAESGIGWVPFMLESLEYNLDEMVGDSPEAKNANRRPTEYFRDHIYVMFWFEQFAPSKLLAEIGVNNVLVETDLPHPTCLYPSPREHFAKILGDVDDYSRRRVLQDNAAELYGIEIAKE